MKKFFFHDIERLFSEEDMISFAIGKSRAGESYIEMVRDMARETKPIARPKAICCIAKVTDRSDQWVDIEGTRLTSPLVARNLENSHRIFPYVATCGTELEEWSKGFTDLLEEYYADQIKLYYLRQIRSYMTACIREQYFPAGHMSSMNPGSLKEWPIRQQSALFKLIGSVTEDTGVFLTESFLMIPSKSISGFYFSSKETYVNCQFCPLLRCPNRKAPYKGEAALRSFFSSRDEEDGLAH